MQEPRELSDEEYAKLDFDGMIADSERLCVEQTAYQAWFDEQNPPTAEELAARKAYIQHMADRAQSSFSPDLFPD